MPKKRRPFSAARKLSRSVPRRKRSSKTTRARARVVAATGGLTVSEVAKLDDLRRELARASGSASPLRWNADADDVQRSVAQLVLTLVDFLRQLLERQAIRRLDEGTLTPAETEAIGLALLRLDQAIRGLARRFGLTPGDLKLDLGPLGRLT